MSTAYIILHIKECERELQLFSAPVCNTVLTASVKRCLVETGLKEIGTQKRACLACFPSVDLLFVVMRYSYLFSLYSFTNIVMILYHLRRCKHPIQRKAVSVCG